MQASKTKIQSVFPVVRQQIFVSNRLHFVNRYSSLYFCFLFARIENVNENINGNILHKICSCNIGRIKIRKRKKKESMQIHKIQMVNSRTNDIHFHYNDGISICVFAFILFVNSFFILILLFSLMQ